MVDEEIAKNASLDKTARKLTDDMQIMANYKALYNEIQRIVTLPIVDKDDFKNSLVTALKNNGLETEIRNTVFHWTRSRGSLHSRSVSHIQVADLSYLKKTQIQWERRIQKSLNSTCNELNIPLARVRLIADRDELAEKWNELSTYDIDLSQYRPLYAPKDFLDVLFSIRDPSFKKQPDELNWDFSHIQISVKTLAQLRRMYSGLAQGMPLLGVNPDMPATENFPNLEAERTHIGEKVLNSNHAPIAQEFLKRGSPRALRGRLWSLVLGSVIKDNDIEYYEELKNMVLQYDIVVDKLIIMDVQLTARNDDQYFVFEDVLYKTMLCFSRDSEILAPVTTDRSAGGQVIHAVLQGKPATLENTLVFPPSGVIPFHGFTMYATPFCYLYDNPYAMYYTFRAFYLRYWFRLHTVSSHEQGIVALCLLFERLLQCHEPQLWIHFKNLHIQPIRIVFKWLMRGFSGHLPPEQLLYLWDLILGYDSLEIIPLLAVTILSFRKENLLQVNTQQNIEAVLADLSSLKVMPLLQLALLRE
ncbi:TBC1 domain family member 19 [Cataglyphis hispanica]|uniref:TBC1 domain family member 19 n=1 Tax=Cataglyphis hispanica TaxID=1086592 RepID=UPI00217FBCC5|nr:TBC1 domain family member 19 [Cataglyphis hispanica]XP_050454917.1 TBC1 domain family member 19 [Cataglyphis hispanica]XP_050454926.1 TBC1 domain family member 19 [Cataglyphis hispanica]XP_050454935.1 TBC1 domain family member 19 [Cataglyphis hispanica]XP_050454943.1 TBC1 domain family member 19 [Cataglyphis hispanica]